VRLRASTLESVHAAALGFWLGAIILAGAAAAILFPTMHSLDPRLPAYSGYSGPHWSLAAGTVANRIFGVAGVMELFAAAVALASLIALVVSRSLPRWLAALRLLLALAIAITFLLRLIPGARISAELIAYEAAARAGNSALAEQHRQVIAAYHPMATTFLGVTAALILSALVVTLVSTVRDRAPEPQETG
jgi:hypothetical protein